MDIVFGTADNSRRPSFHAYALAGADHISTSGHYFIVTFSSNSFQRAHWKVLKILCGDFMPKRRQTKADRAATRASRDDGRVRYGQKLSNRDPASPHPATSRCSSENTTDSGSSRESMQMSTLVLEPGSLLEVLRDTGRGDIWTEAVVEATDDNHGKWCSLTMMAHIHHRYS